MSPGWVPAGDEIIEAVLSGDYKEPRGTVLYREDRLALFYPGALNGIFGESECGKTWLALLAAKQELERGHHVVYMNYEDSASKTLVRLLALGVDPAALRTGKFSHFTDPPPILVEDSANESYLLNLISERGKPSLVVVDGVTPAMSMLDLNPDKGIEVDRFYSAAPTWWARRGAAVVLIDHVTKSKDYRGRWAIGSERKVSGLDGAAYTVDVRKQFAKGRSGYAMVRISKDRNGSVREHEAEDKLIAVFKLSSEAGDGKVTAELCVPEPAEDKLASCMAQIDRLLSTSKEPLGIRAIRDGVRGSNVMKTRALDKLVEQGYVEAISGSRKGQTVYRRVRPYEVNPVLKAVA